MKKMKDEVKEDQVAKLITEASVIFDPLLVKLRDDLKQLGYKLILTTTETGEFEFSTLNLNR